MIKADNLKTYDHRELVDETFIISEEEKLPNPPVEEYLIEPNLDFSNQTLKYRLNGNSNTLFVGYNQFPLFPVFHQPSREHFKTIQKWEGLVIEVRKDTFLAKLVKILGEGLDQEAEIYIEEVEQEDHNLIKPGAMFYWTIGYLDRPSGRLRASIIRFRRLSLWSKLELESAEAKMKELKELLDVK